MLVNVTKVMYSENEHIHFIKKCCSKVCHTVCVGSTSVLSFQVLFYMAYHSNKWNPLTRIFSETPHVDLEISKVRYDLSLPPFFLWRWGGFVWSKHKPTQHMHQAHKLWAKESRRKEKERDVDQASCGWATYLPLTRSMALKFFNKIMHLWCL